MLRIGAHVDQADPIAEAVARSADLVQFFLGDPQGWKAPVFAYPGGAPALKAAAEAAGVDLYVHAPYVLNVATTNNRIRIPSRKLLQQHVDAAAEIGVKGLIVHGGHVLKTDDPAVGFDNWRKTFERLELRVPGPHREHRGRRERDGPATRRDRAAVGRGGRLRRGVLPRHLPRPRGRRGARDGGGPGEGDHRAGST